MAIHRGIGRGSAVAGADRKRQVVGADFAIAKEKAAIHQGPSKVFEAEVGQNQAARIARGGSKTRGTFLSDRAAPLNKAASFAQSPILQTAGIPCSRQVLLNQGSSYKAATACPSLCRGSSAPNSLPCRSEASVRNRHQRNHPGSPAIPFGLEHRTCLVIVQGV